MKKTIIAMLALSGVAFGAVKSGTYTLSMDQWTTGDTTLYDYLNGAINEGGNVTFTLGVKVTGTVSCDAYQTLIHIGQNGTGMSIMANGLDKIIVGEKNSTDDSVDNHELNQGSLTTDFENTVLVSITGKTKGTASVDITINGTEYKGLVNDLVWSEMVWNTTNDEHAKYSINCGAPGFSSLTPAQVTTLTSATATYTAIPEPTTATLSLLALAGLAARRRRK